MMKHCIKLTGSIKGPAYYRAWTNHKFKETVGVISCDPACRDGDADLQWYPW